MFPLLTALTGDPQTAAFFEPRCEIAALMDVEAALAESQGALGLIGIEASRRIAAGCRAVVLDEGSLRAGLARDGVVVPDLVRQLRAALGAADAGGVHLGATSQDIQDTALMLRLREVLRLHGARLDDLAATLHAISQEQGDLPLMAQTRMQAALPFTVADKLATWTRPLEHHRHRLAGLATGLPIQLGGPVGDGRSFGPLYAPLRAAMADRLGLHDAPCWHADRTVILDIAQAFALLTGTLGKIGQDIALMVGATPPPAIDAPARGGQPSGDQPSLVETKDERTNRTPPQMATLRLARGGGSSAMAHKQNPVGAEVLVALARLNAGLLGTLSQSMIHENERSGAAWTLEWMVLPQMAQAAGRAALVARETFEGARFAECLFKKGGAGEAQ